MQNRIFNSEWSEEHIDFIMMYFFVCVHDFGKKDCSNLKQQRCSLVAN